jgi:hypothetical protein
VGKIGLKQKYTERMETKWASKPPAHAQDRLAQMDKIGTDYFGFNEALIFYNGGLRKTVAKSKEAGDFSNSGSPPRITLTPGVGAGTFSLTCKEAVLKVGVSICADHSRVAEYEKSVDLLFLLSNTIHASIVKPGIVRRGGLMVYSDGVEQNQIIKGPSLSPENDRLKEEVWLAERASENGQMLAARCLITVGPRT